jgi:hypothetical protein
MNSIVNSLFSILNVGRLQVSPEELACTFLVIKNSCQLMLINELVAGSKVMAACSHVNFFRSNNISLQPFGGQTTVLAVCLRVRHGSKCGVLGESLTSCHNRESASSCPPVFS